jgi:PilZ domain
MAKQDLRTGEGQSYARAYDRLPVNARMYFSGDQEEGTGTVQDISVGGWRVRSTHTHVKPGEDVTFFATLPDHQQAVLVDHARVCWSRGDEFGLAIGKMTTQDAKRLKGFLSTHLVVRTREM